MNLAACRWAASTSGSMPAAPPAVVGPPLARRLGQRGWQGVALPEAERGFERAPEVGTIDRKAGGDDDEIREIFGAAARAAAGAVPPRVGVDLLRHLDRQGQGGYPQRADAGEDAGLRTLALVALASCASATAGFSVLSLPGLGQTRPGSPRRWFRVSASSAREPYSSPAVSASEG